MPFISGIYYRDSRPAGAHIATLAQSAAKGEAANFTSKNIQLFAQQNGTILYTDAETGLTLVGDICLYNMKELSGLLGEPYSDGLNALGKLVIKAYKKWGKACPGYFSGEFAFAIWNETEQEIFCARDQVGHYPLYYYLDESTFVFSTKLHFLEKFSFSASYNEACIRKMMLRSYETEDREQTVFSAVKRLLPAYTITVSKTGQQTEKYWELNNKKQQKTTNIAEAAEMLRWHIDNAVKQRVQPGGINGIELSGGLDSSAVALFGQQYLATGQKELLAFSNALPESHKTHYPGFRDESDRIEAIKKQLNLQKHINIDSHSENPVGLLAKGVMDIGYAPAVTINISQQPLYGIAQQHHVSTLFSGFGGDEMVSANLYNIHLDTLIQSGELVKAAGQVQSQGYSAFKSYAHVYMRYARRLLRMEEVHAPTAETLLVHNGHTNNKKTGTLSSIQEWYRFKLGLPGVLERLETGYHVTENHGIRYKYPLLDVPLLEYFYTLPDEWKTGHRHGRALFRMALEGLLPDEVVHTNKARNTFVVPVLKMEMEMHFTRLRNWILDLSPQHRLFGYVDRQQVEKLQQGSKDEARLYEMMRKLIMLALFFDYQQGRRLYEI